MELRVLREMSLLLPITEIRDEDYGGYTIRNGRGISPVTVGQEWFRKEATKIASIVPIDSKKTGIFRERGNNHGHQWIGQCLVTQTPFIVLTRPKLFRRKLHQEQYKKGGIIKRQGGTITPFGFRCGDYVETRRKWQIIRGWIGGFTNSKSSKNVSIYDHNWKRIGQFNPKNVRLLNRSSKLCIAR